MPPRSQPKGPMKSRPQQRKRQRSADLSEAPSQGSRKEHDIGEISTKEEQQELQLSSQDRRPTTKRLKKSAHQAAVSTTQAVVSTESSVTTTTDKHIRLNEVDGPSESTLQSSGLTTKVSPTSLSPQATSEISARHNNVSSSPIFSADAPSGSIQELSFSPLRTVLDERLKRRLRRSGLSEEVNAIENETRAGRRAAKESLREMRETLTKTQEQVKQLQLDLEIQRQFQTANGNEAEEQTNKLKADLTSKEEQLQKLTEEIQNRQQHDLPSEDADADIHGDDALLFIEADQQDDLPSPSGHAGASVEHPASNSNQVPAGASTQMTLEERLWDNEREDYEKALITANKELGERTALLQILTIELENLGFLLNDQNSGIADTMEKTPNVLAVVASIRDTLQKTKAELEFLLPEKISKATSTNEIFNIAIANIRLLQERQAEATTTIQQSQSMEVLLNKQCKELLDKLGEMEARHESLKVQWNELDLSNDHKEKRNIELRDLIKQLDIAARDRDALVVQKDSQLTSLQTETANQSQDLDKLRTTLQNYVNEEARLQSFILKLEEQQANKIADLTRKHDASTKKWTKALEIEKGHLGQAEAEIHTKTAVITALELRLEDDGVKVDKLNVQLAGSVATMTNEQKRRQIAEEALKDQHKFVKGLEEQIADGKADLSETQAEVKGLKEHLRTEQTQREKTENTLDNANEEIENLQKEVNAKGIEANELRQKIFEAQVAKEAAIKKLQEDANTLEEDLRHNLAAETEHRKTAEQIATDHEGVITDLKQKLKSTEQEMVKLLHGKDKSLKSQAETITGLRGELDSKSSRLDVVSNDLELLKKQNRKEVASLHASLHNVNEDLRSRNYTIQTLESDAVKLATRTSQDINDRNQRITQLSNELHGIKDTVETLRAEKTSLERRVESEAENMLEQQNLHAEDRNTLRTNLANKHAELQSWQQKATDLELDLNATIAEKDDEINTLKSEVQVHDTTIQALRAENRGLKGRLLKTVKKRNDALARAQKDIENARLGVDAEVQEGEKDSQEVLADIEMQDVDEVVTVKTNETSNGVVANGQNVAKEVKTVKSVKAVSAVQKVRRSGRYRDSGIGMANSSDGVEPEEAF
ncbi:MAG: hypothetical protein M1820_003601 [Bogoriella megaspora]|nr:MAG: hypothetical protein M1820_003601 [Bogoriella megaspora]